MFLFGVESLIFSINFILFNFTHIKIAGMLCSKKKLGETRDSYFAVFCYNFTSHPVN